MIGRVKWWSKDQGYGFIELSENENIFVHINESDKKKIILKENEQIKFQVEEKEIGKIIFDLISLKALN